VAILKHLDAPDSRERDPQVPVYRFGLLDARQMPDQIATVNFKLSHANLALLPFVAPARDLDSSEGPPQTLLRRLAATVPRATRHSSPLERA
jgi:hypothetical protein